MADPTASQESGGDRYMETIEILEAIKTPSHGGGLESLTDGAEERMLKLRATAGVSLPPSSVKMQSRTKSVQIPRQSIALRAG